MIIGIGNDVVNIERINKTIRCFGNKFLTKILSTRELHEVKKITNNDKVAAFCAKRFAGKESFVKALGTGFRDGIIFQDIEIINDNKGKPQLRVYNRTLAKLLELTPKNSNYQIDISLSDDYPVAYAIVVISSNHHPNSLSYSLI